MLEQRKFDVEIARRIDDRALRWPSRHEVIDGRNPGCNREYMDLRGLTWGDVDRIADLEAALIVRIETAENSSEEYDKILDELYDDEEGLLGLDIGIASVVAALSAMGCIPFSSCNAGAYGGFHHERHPVVAFFAQSRHTSVLLECAERSGAGLESNEEGTVILYADDMQKIRAFRDELSHRLNQT